MCTVKRCRKPSLPLLATQPAIVPDILQAFPKVSSDRSRSPGPLVDVPALPVQPLDLMHDDHRHRLGLGSRLQLRPARPLPSPAVLPRSTRPCLIPPAAATATPPMPRAKQRAAFYAKHNRVPRPAGNGVTSSHAAGSSPAVVPNSSASPTVRLGSGMLRPHRGGSAKHPGGPYSSAIIASAAVCQRSSGLGNCAALIARLFPSAARSCAQYAFC